ncbi:DUF2855 family protein [Glacieibacterium sp.]|uniref:DUF2855 family protein n=1 Tax=Glacieibacterium sp. TaxID=2860237 RepID=UPI003B00C1DC
MINEVQVSRVDLADARLVERSDEIADGQAAFSIEHFALTSNNITYAAHGVDMRYWDFFPAAAGWGVVPVWGFARVIASKVDGLAVGDRFYGYWPMASGAVLTPVKVSARGFVDGAAHRAELAAVYNSYVRADPGMGDDAAYALFRPLYVTSFLIDAMLAAGDDRLLLSSASSKTALGLAQAARARGAMVIGLTSARNRAFTETTGNYDLVAAYDEIEVLPLGPTTTYVDFSGDGGLRAAIHARFDATLGASWVIGDTHWDVPAKTARLTGPRPQFFFAPTVAAERMAEWGAAGFEQRLADSWTAFVASTAPWLRTVEGHGPAAAMSAYARMVAGDIDPAEGIVLSI